MIEALAGLASRELSNSHGSRDSPICRISQLELALTEHAHRAFDASPHTHQHVFNAYVHACVLT